MTQTLLRNADTFSSLHSISRHPTAIMVGKIDYPRNDKYRKDYTEALEPWEKGLHEKCVEAAKYIKMSIAVQLVASLTQQTGTT